MLNKQNKKKIILSGVQPSGKFHIGNYFGAIKHWIPFQETSELFCFIADLHALTVPQTPKEFQKQILDAAIDLLSLGINPEKATIFIQSSIPQHAELMWLLSTIVPVGELERMVSYKEKVFEGKEAFAGLLNYPVLMAADILLYQADLVPVGDDQKQHLEFTRKLARRFNNRFGEIFNIPKDFIPEIGARIMSLDDPFKKMSKSYSDNSCINLNDSPSIIKTKIKNAVTDSGKDIIFDPLKKPAISNLLNIYHLFSGKEIPEIERKFQDKGYAEFKKSLAEVIINGIKPYQTKRRKFKKDLNFVKNILKQGNERAGKIAGQTLTKVKAAMGLLISC